MSIKTAENFRKAAEEEKNKDPNPDNPYYDRPIEILDLMKGVGLEWPGKCIEGNAAYDIALVACLNSDLKLLSIKGPPGTGKTKLLANVANNLAKTGKNVGIVSKSNEAVVNALKEANVPNNKITKENLNQCNVPQIWGATIASVLNYYDKSSTITSKNLHKSHKCDVLLIDEASQVPAYEAFAMSCLADRMIFFGDEDQLPNITHGDHDKEGHGGSSAMKYLSEVLNDSLHYCLEKSHRMNGQICDLIKSHFYPNINLHAGRNEDAHLQEDGKKFPSLIKHELSHASNQSCSTDEAIEIANLVSRLLEMEFVGDGEAARKLKQDDIVILTPFNEQVEEIKKNLKKYSKIKVGTVDCMQGQSAAVVIYSLASSEPLYLAYFSEWYLSSNRWNVAISRAKACAIVVGNFTVLSQLRSYILTDDGIKVWTAIEKLMRDTKWQPLPFKAVSSSTPSTATTVKASATSPPPSTPPHSASAPLIPIELTSNDTMLRLSRVITIDHLEWGASQKYVYFNEFIGKFYDLKSLAEGSKPPVTRVETAFVSAINNSSRNTPGFRWPPMAYLWDCYAEIKKVNENPPPVSRALFVKSTK
jgi:uncharacterized protein